MTEHICNKEKEIAVLQEQSKSHGERLTRLEIMHEEIRDMNTNIKLLVHQIGEITRQVVNNSDGIRDLREQPSKDFSQIKLAVVISIMTLIAGTLVGKLL